MLEIFILNLLELFLHQYSKRCIIKKQIILRVLLKKNIYFTSILYGTIKFSLYVDNNLIAKNDKNRILSLFGTIF